VLDSAEQPPRALEFALVLTLSGTGEAAVRASYLVPCAAWHPANRATLQGDTVAVEAVAWQRTLLAVQLLAPGVYVAMHNQVLCFPGVVKDAERLRFVRASGA